MRIFIFLAFLSLSSFAEEPVSSLGQVDNNQSMNDCNAPEVVGCGPCYKLCIEQNKSERGFKETSDTLRRPTKSSVQGASGQ